jgi:uncharacterized membrane protein
MLIFIFVLIVGLISAVSAPWYAWSNGVMDSLPSGIRVISLSVLIGVPAFWGTFCYIGIFAIYLSMTFQYADLVASYTRYLRARFQPNIRTITRASNGGVPNHYVTHLKRSQRFSHNTRVTFPSSSSS